MRTNLGSAILFAALSAALGVSACSDDGDSTTPGVGGDAMGGEPSSSAGSGAGKGGGTSGTAGTSSTNGGAAGSGAAGTGTGGASDLPGGAGGVPQGMAGATGDAGAGGTGAPPLEYACTATTINHKVCSAFAAAACPEEFDCATCVADRKAEHDLYVGCGTCLAEFDKFFQCAVDAFEKNDLAAGVECAPGIGPDFTLPCYELWTTADNCREWTIENPCPAEWPLP